MKQMRDSLLWALVIALMSVTRMTAAVRSAAPDTLQVLQQYYQQLLDQKVSQHQAEEANVRQMASQVLLSPYYYRIMTAGTLYAQPLSHTMGIRWNLGQSTSQFPSLLDRLGPSDSILVRQQAIDEAMAQLYVSSPRLVTQTEDEMRQRPALRTDIETPIKNEVSLTETFETMDLGNDDDGSILPVVFRPNFWKFSGNGSLQFTQNFFSTNWYQGGENNYSALGLVTLNANFDNKQKIQWENKLELQLGFQTSKSDTCRELRVTSNLIRLTSKLGYKATKHWFYTGQVQTYTQLYPNYQTNSYNVTTDFLSPLNLVISVGMDFKFSLKRISGSLYMAPIAYTMKYCDRMNLSTRYGIEKDHRAKHELGPNVTFNYNWKMAKNVTWQCRLYWATNLHYTNMECENTFTFQVNKYLNCKLFAYPRYNDSSHRTREVSKKDTYWMFKEFLSLGVSYNF